MDRVIVIALALFLATSLGALVVNSKAEAPGVETQQSRPQLLPEGQTTEDGCSMDPWGCPEGGHP